MSRVGGLPGQEGLDPIRTRIAAFEKYLRGEGRFGFDLLAKEDVDGRDVINIGCGLAHQDAAFLARTGARPRRYLLLDKSEDMACTALRNCAAFGRGIEARRARFEGLKAEEAGQFDLAICMHVLFHLPEPEKELRHIASLLKPGGRALVTTPFAGNYAEFTALHREVTGVSVADPTVSFNSDNAETLMARVFARVSTAVYEGWLVFEQVDAALDYYLSLTQYREGADGETDREMARRIAERIRREGCFSLSASSLTLFGTLLGEKAL